MYLNKPDYLSNIELSLNATTSPDNLHQRICDVYHNNKYLNTMRPTKDHDD